MSEASNDNAFECNGRNYVVRVTIVDMDFVFEVFDGQQPTGCKLRIHFPKVVDQMKEDSFAMAHGSWRDSAIRAIKDCFIEAMKCKQSE